MERKNFDDALSGSQDWVETTRMIRAATEEPGKQGFATQSDVIQAAARVLSRTPTALWNLLGALQARDLLFADLDDAEAARLPQTKLTAARVLLRKHPQRHEAIVQAVRDPKITTRALASSVEKLSTHRAGANAQELEDAVFDFLANDPSNLGLERGVHVRRASARELVQPDLIVEDSDGKALVGIEVKTRLPERSRDSQMLGGLMLVAHVCNSAVLIGPLDIAEALAALARSAEKKLEITNVRFAEFRTGSDGMKSLRFIR